ncbi:MAG: DUF1330 domain-containing protein [Acidobacteria bacterium]|nr:DUF1330 domain-containing protein [Acidobacteriota bacterium]
MPDSRPTYFVAHFAIDDREEYGRYEKAFFPLFSGTGGTFMALDDEAPVLEGEREPGRTVLLGYPSREALLEHWNSEPYQEIARHRRAGTTTYSIFLLEGLKGSAVPELEPGGEAVRLLAHFTIDDPEAFSAYEQGIVPSAAPFGGRLLAYDDDPEILEGGRAPGRTALLEFDSEEALRQWWDSPGYRELAAIRQASTTTHSICFLKAMRVAP